MHDWQIFIKSHSRLPSKRIAINQSQHALKILVELQVAVDLGGLLPQRVGLAHLAGGRAQPAQALKRLGEVEVCDRKALRQIQHVLQDLVALVRVAAQGFYERQRSEERRVGKECRSRWGP